MVEKAEVACTEPAVRAEHARRRLRIVVVALHDARALHLDLAFDVRGECHRRPVLRARHDAHGHAATRIAGRYETPGVIDADGLSPRPHRDRERRLGQAVAGRDHVLDAEVSLEPANGRQPHGLRARERRLERGQIEVVRVPYVAHAVAVAEVRRHGERRAHLRHQLEPLPRIAQVRRQQPHGRGHERRRERQPDQSHVVIERQPGDDTVVRRETSRRRHEVAGLDDVPVREHHAARLAGAAGRVLEEREILGARLRERRRGPVDVEIRRLQHLAHVRRKRHALVHTVAEPSDRRDRHRVGVAEDVRGRVHTERRIERDGHRAEADGAEERVEELRARRIDEADLVAGAHARPREPGAIPRALRPQPPVRHGLVEEPKVLPIRRARHAPPHHLREGRGRSHVIVDHSPLLGFPTAG